MKVELKVAKIESTRLQDSTKDNLFRCRVLPDMEYITEVDLLPTYPNFFATSNELFDPGDSVWVVCSDDFQVGFILGKAQSSSGTPLAPLVGQINANEEALGLEPSFYDDMTLDYVEGAYMAYHCKSTGRNGYIYNTAAMIIIDSDGTTYFRNTGATVRITGSGEIMIQGTSVETSVQTTATTSAVEIVEKVQSKRSEVAGTEKETIGGSYQQIVAGNHVQNVVGDTTLLTGKQRKETIGLGSDTKIIAGGKSETVLLGNYNINVALGQVQIISGGGVRIIAPSIELIAASITVPPLPVLPTGLGPFCALPFCLFSGVPHAGFRAGI